MYSTKSGSQWYLIGQVFCPWASSYGTNGQITMMLHNLRSRQFHRSFEQTNFPQQFQMICDLQSLVATCQPARISTTIPLQPRGLRGKKWWFRSFFNQEHAFPCAICKMPTILCLNVLMVVQPLALTHCGLVTPYGNIKLGETLASGNGLLPYNTKPLPEPMLSCHQGVLWHSPGSNFTSNGHESNPWYVFRNYIFKITSTSHRD